LDLAIKSLLPLAQVPSIAYPELVKSGAVNLLIGLLTHENMDIVIDVVELIHELTDEDVGADEEQEETEDAEEPLKLLVDNLVSFLRLDSSPHWTWCIGGKFDFRSAHRQPTTSQRG
jgi:beta-catenin-like protein 1